MESEGGSDIFRPNHDYNYDWEANEHALDTICGLSTQWDLHLQS